MRAAIVSEYRKYFSTRIWWILALCMFVFFLLISFALAWLFAYQVNHHGMTDELLAIVRPTVYGLAASMGYIVPVIVGALAVTAEYRHNTVLPTFVSEPRRWVVMVAKAIAGVPMGVVIGVIATASCLLGGYLGFQSGGIDSLMTSGMTWRNALLSVLACTLWALVGVGLGMLVTSQVGVIIAVLAFTQLIEPIVSMGLNAFSFGPAVGKFLPSSASGSLAGGTNIYALMNGLEANGLSIGQGAVVMAGYGVVFALLGYYLRIRRNVA